MANTADEDRILRVWTPVILRVSVTASVIILAAGLLIIGIVNPDAYVARVRQIQANGASFPKEQWGPLVKEAFEGQPRALLMLGLLVLTLVPLGRVAFTFFFFLKQRDVPFIFLTATVLLLLVLGVLLGRVG